MKFYTQDIVKKVRELRAEGLSTAEIFKKTGAPKNTILRWCLDMPSKEPYHLKIEKIKGELKYRGVKTVKNIKVNKNTAKIYTSLIYWCEGYKYAGCNCVGFANSDPVLIKTFLELFRIGFQPKEEKFRIHLQLHTTHDRKNIITFWSELLKIPQNQFQKPTITVAQNRMKRFNYKGTCTIKYCDYSLYNEIVGIYEAFSKKV